MLPEKKETKRLEADFSGFVPDPNQVRFCWGVKDLPGRVYWDSVFSCMNAACNPFTSITFLFCLKSPVGI
jgi:hypothetical protein